MEALPLFQAYSSSPSSETLQWRTRQSESRVNSWTLITIREGHRLTRCTPARSIRLFASSASFAVAVPLASVFAQTEYPASRSERARNIVPGRQDEQPFIRSRPPEQDQYSQTSVTMPPRTTCFLPVASTALRKSGLSQAFTSPLRLMKGASGYRSIISLGSGPLGPAPREHTGLQTRFGPRYLVRLRSS